MFNTELCNSYRVVTNLMVSFGLVIEHDKLEIFHFSRVHNNSNPELNLSAISTFTLKPKTYRDTWAFILISIYPLRNMFVTTLPRHCYGILWTLTIFPFFYLISLSLYLFYFLFSFWFSFGQRKGMWYYRPRTW